MLNEWEPSVRSRLALSTAFLCPSHNLTATCWVPVITRDAIDEFGSRKGLGVLQVLWRGLRICGGLQMKGVEKFITLWYDF